MSEDRPKSSVDDPEGKDLSLAKPILAIALMVIVVGSISFFISQTVGEDQINRFVETLRSVGDHWWAPIALIVAFIVVNLTGLPGTPFTLAAGAVWGWLAGGAWVMVATMIGTAVPYYIALRGFPRIQEVLERRFSGVYERIDREGLTAVLLLRLLHIFPFAAISYASGFAKVRPLHYFLGTFLGTLPGVFIYAYLADSILQELVSPREAMTRMLTAGFLLAVLVVASRLVAKRVGRSSSA
ncbi:MAG: VTT domain-containing protein [Thermoanaerobaculia bacterium]|nr:VTT domain-containing protein [Thermoanaerobaculia bacterium]